MRLNSVAFDGITYSLFVCFVRFIVLGVGKVVYFPVVCLRWSLFALCLLAFWWVCGA